MIGHHVPFDDLYSLISAQGADIAGYVLSQLIVYHLAAVLGDEDDVILAHPPGMCRSIVLFCHMI